MITDHPFIQSEVQGDPLCVYVPDGTSFDRCGRTSAGHEKSAALHPVYSGVQVQEPAVTGAEAVSFFNECVDLMMKKDALYGGAWKAQGYMGNVARVLSKVERLKNLLWRDGIPDTDKETEETIEDTLQDLVNLAFFTRSNYQSGNRWGDR